MTLENQLNKLSLNKKTPQTILDLVDEDDDASDDNSEYMYESDAEMDEEFDIEQMKIQSVPEPMYSSPNIEKVFHFDEQTFRVIQKWADTPSDDESYQESDTESKCDTDTQAMED